MGIAQSRHASITYTLFHLQPLRKFHRQNHILDIQGSHTSEIANSTHGIEVRSHPDISVDIHQRFKYISDSWAVLIGLSPFQEIVSLIPGALVAPPRIELPPFSLNSSMSLVAMHIRERLSIFLPDVKSPAFLSPEQELAIHLTSAVNIELIVV